MKSLLALIGGWAVLLLVCNIGFRWTNGKIPPHKTILGYLRAVGRYFHYRRLYWSFDTWAGSKGAIAALTNEGKIVPLKGYAGRRMWIAESDELLHSDDIDMISNPRFEAGYD